MEVRKNIFANDSQIEHKSYIAGISKAKRFTHLFAWGETNLATAPFGGAGEEGGKSSKYASYELLRKAA